MEKRAAFEKRLHRVQHSPWVLALALAPALCVLLWTPNPQYRGLQIILAVVAFVVGPALARRMPKVRVPVAVNASREGISLNGKLVPRAQIRAALLVPTGEDQPPQVRIVRRGMRPDIELSVRDVAMGRKLLRALGFDASQATATFSSQSLVAALTRETDTIWVIAVTMVIGFVLLILSLWLFLGVALAMSVLRLLPMKVDIGADGIGTRWLFWRRFMPWSDIESYRRYFEVPAPDGIGSRDIRNMGISLTLRSGEDVAFPMSTEHQLAMFEERMREAEEAHDGRPVGEGASALSRGDRSVSDWIVHLRGIGAGANAGPRTAPVDHDKLFRIVEDPQADATARVAAAVALAREVDEDGRARLETAAEATVAPRLRVAIEAAAKDDEAAVTEALAALDEEQDARSQARS